MERGGRAGREVRYENMFAMTSHNDRRFLICLLRGKKHFSLALWVAAYISGRVRARSALRKESTDATGTFLLVFLMPCSRCFFYMLVACVQTRRAAVGSGIALAAHVAFSERARRQVSEISQRLPPRGFVAPIVPPGERVCFPANSSV